ncbi:TPA: hypothetical protein ACGO1T_000555 [Streptococcus suis]
MENSVHQNQIKLVETIDMIVQDRVKNASTTMSTIGIVKTDPNNYSCTVTIKDQEVTCSVPEHLHSWIQKDDIVIIQDLYNDGQSKVIVGKTGQLEKNPSIVIYDESIGKDISGVDGVFEDDVKITYAHIHAQKGF